MEAKKRTPETRNRKSKKTESNEKMRKQVDVGSTRFTSKQVRNIPTLVHIKVTTHIF